MNNRNETVKRIVIFCLLSFAPYCIIMPLVNSHCGGYVYVNENAGAIVYALGLGMFFPAAASVLTRLITKEGFKDTYLDIHFKGNVKYYIASVLYKPAEALLEVIVIRLYFMKGMSFSETFTVGSGGVNIAYALIQIGLSVIFFLPAFGEELGWRGYLMPKLLSIMNKPAAVVTGGIIWGLWHAPLTMSGHNFGINYKGFPYIGILIMCVYCIAVNALLTLLTERTGSVYPASICHMVNNNLSAGAILSLFSTDRAYEDMEKMIQGIRIWYVILPVTVIAGIVSMAIYLKRGNSVSQT